MSNPPALRPKADWTISNVQMRRLLKKWAHDESQMTDKQIAIRTMELVMKERYGPEIEKMFGELSEALDSVIGHQSDAIAGQEKALNSMSSMKDIVDKYRTLTGDAKDGDK